jgi:hypothetical protein
MADQGAAAEMLAEATARLDALSSRVDELESALDAAWAAGPPVQPEAAARWHSTLAHAAAALVAVVCKTRGLAPEQQPQLGAELSRLSQYFEKVAPPRTSRLDVQAARRFLGHALPQIRNSRAAGSEADTFLSSLGPAA